MNKKKTGSSISSRASKTLTNSHSSAIQRSLAGSALSQSNTNKQTSKTMETKALAGSLLAQSNKKR
ncbi:hypothetical protein [Clostridium sp.]|uniref:hypothetical protein n=1 Tax=Clostridium sp. TaxID=1506 RepID=UPI002FC687CE